MVYGMRNCKYHAIGCLQCPNDVKTSLECEILPKNTKKKSEKIIFFLMIFGMVVFDGF